MSIRSAAAALAVIACLVPGVAPGQSLDARSADALSQTLGALQGLSPDAAGSLDPRLGAIQSSPELTREFNALTSAIFTELVQRSGGDPAAMNAEVERARSNPAGFAESFSPETRARLEALSRKLEE